MNSPQPIEKEKWLQDAISQKWIPILSLSAFLGIGIWMLIAPEGMEHASIEKSTVYLVKEMWSFNTGLVFSAIAVFFLIKTILKIRLMKSFCWVKQDAGGYYLFENQIRISGMESLYDGDDLISFNPSRNEVYNLKKYAKTKNGKYRKARFDDRFNCNDAFWTKEDSGYYLYDKGKRVNNLTSEYRGDDLIVTATGLGKRFRLGNYKQSAKNKIHQASKF